jgi:hypothetical protein
MTEAEHFKRCPLCGGYVDMRDLIRLDDHQGPLPHPAYRAMDVCMPHSDQPRATMTASWKSKLRRMRG